MIVGWLNDACRAEKEGDEIERKSIDALKGGLLKLKNESIGYGLRTLVRMCLADTESDTEALGREIVALYRKRSRLTHSGTSVIGNDLTRLDDIVRQILEAMMRRGAEPAVSK